MLIIVFVFCQLCLTPFLIPIYRVRLQIERLSVQIRLFSKQPWRPDPPRASTPDDDESYDNSDESKYIILRRVGAGAVGGQGELWHALHKSSGRTVVCKRIKIDSRDRDKLKYAIREAVTLDILAGGPHIIKIHDTEIGLGNGQCEIRIFTDFYPGGDLAGAITDCSNRRVKIPEASIVAIARQIAEALSFCHAKGFWHRDLNPRNVILESPWQRPESQSPPDILLIDFGLARFTGNATSTYDFWVGTLGFFSPELRSSGVSRKVTSTTSARSSSASWHSPCLIPMTEWRTTQLLGSPKPTVPNFENSSPRCSRATATKDRAPMRSPSA
ncbi:Protein kinase-like domain containing protein [Rhypophila decipiens]